MRVVGIFCLIMIIPFSAFAAPLTARDLEASIEEILHTAAGEKPVCIALKNRWGRLPTVREVLQSPWTLIETPDSAGWSPFLMRALAERNVSIAMSDDDILMVLRHPDNVKFRDLRYYFNNTLGFYLFCKMFEEENLFTVHDLVSRFANQKEFAQFINDSLSGRLADVPGLTKYKVQALESDYARLLDAYLADLKFRDIPNRNFLGQFSLELASIFMENELQATDKLYRLSDSELCDLLGKNMKLISELYLFMAKNKIYESPGRCSKAFGNPR